MDVREAVLAAASLVAGLFGGWWIASLVGGTAGEDVADLGLALPAVEAADVARDEIELTAPEPSPARRPAPDVPVAPAAPTRDTPSRVAGDALVGPALERHARQGIARGWRAVRPDDIPPAELAVGFAQFEELVAEAPEAIGIRLAANWNERSAAAEHGEVFVVLAELSQRTRAAPALELVDDAGAYAELFEPRVSSSRLDGIDHLEHPDLAIEDGTTLRFSPGVFRPKNLMKEMDPFPRDVAIEGAGMDATLLVLDELYTRHRLANFTLRDCTVFLDGNLFDLRSEPASLRLEDVRLIGFDIGAGGSYLLSTRGIAVLATDCRFEGGYGRSPMHSRFFRRSGPDQIFRFERCTFARMELDLSATDEATIVFDRCTLTDLLDRPWSEAELPRGVKLSATEVGFIAADRRHDPPRLDLNDLFPGWEARVGG